MTSNSKQSLEPNSANWNQILSQAVEQSSDGMAIADLDGILLYVNPAWQKMHGFEETDKLIGSHLSIFHNKKQLETDVIPFNKLVIENGSHSGEVGHIKKDGTPFPTTMTTTLLRNMDGKAYGFLGVSKDITTSKKLVDIENKFKRLFDTMLEGVCLHDVIYDDDRTAIDYRIIDINPRYTTLTGLSKEQAVGCLASELYGTGEPPYIDIFSKVADTGAPYTFETYFPPLEKHFNISVFSPQKGKFVTIFTDITSIKETEKALRESEAELKAIIDNSPTGITISDVKGHIIRTNPAHQNIIGYRLDELQSMTFSDFTHPHDVGKQQKLFEELISGKRNHFKMTKRFIHKKGHVVWAQVSLSLIKNKNNKPLFVIGIVEDITERIRAEDEKEKLIAGLQQALDEIKVLKGIIPICSHCKQIRNDKGFWDRVENYIEKHTNATFSHGVCPDCLEKHYPEIIDKRNRE